MDVGVPALVLGLARERFQHGSLGIMRSLGRCGIEVHAAFRETDTPACSSRYVAAKHQLPGSGIEETLDRLGSIGRSVGNRPVVFATDDVAADLLVSHGQRLESIFRFPQPAPEVVRALSNKEEMAENCIRLGVPTPRVEKPDTAADLKDAVCRLGLPVVVKAIDAAAVQSASGTSVALAETIEEVEERFREMTGEVNGNVMLQELIPGGPDQVWMFNGYFDDEGRCKAAYSGRKIRQYPPYTGMTSLGECRYQSEVVEHATTLLTGLAYKGPVDLGMRFDQRDGRYKMLDVNPRMGATFRLFVDADGRDVARTMYLDLTGQDPGEPARAVEGRRWFIEHFDVVSALTHVRRGELGVRRWLSSLRGIREAAWFARDDLKPFMAMFADGVKMLSRWVLRRLGVKR